jgi:hypothetical protein
MPPRIESVSYADSTAVNVNSESSREDAILATAGWLLSLRLDDSEAIRYAFGKRFGNGPLGPASSERVQVIESEGVMRVAFSITSAHDWDNLRRAGYLEGYPESYRMVFRDHGSKRRRWHKPETIIRAVAVHYLSTACGITLTAAADRYSSRFPGGPDDVWDPVRQSRLIGQLEREYGPLP